MESSPHRRSLLAASIFTVAFVSVSVGAGCAAEAPLEDEPVGSSADALLMACGTKGTSSYSRSGGGKIFSTGYIEDSNEERCLAAVCTRPTQAEWAAAYKLAEAYMIADCVDELSRHTCPAGCKLSVTTSCVAQSAREDGPLAPIGGGPLCTKNLQGKWQKDCRFAVAVLMNGTAQVTCGPMGSAPISDGGSSTTDAGTTSSDGGTTTTDSGTTKTDAGT